MSDTTNAQINGKTNGNVHTSPNNVSTSVRK